jgi:hypothetical protein
VRAVIVFKEAYQLAVKEHRALPPNCGNPDARILPLLSPTRERMLDEKIFLGLLQHAATVLNPGFQAAVLERICDHLSASLPDGLLQGGPAQTADFFRDSDLFVTECIYVDPSSNPSQPVRVAATASLGWQDVARPQAEDAATLMVGGVPLFSRARSAGHEGRPVLAGPAGWRAQEMSQDSRPVGSAATAMMGVRAPEEPWEGRAGGVVGFTRSRSAADWEEVGTAGKLAVGGWDAVNVFTRSRYQDQISDSLSCSASLSCSDVVPRCRGDMCGAVLFLLGSMCYEPSSLLKLE